MTHYWDFVERLAHFRTVFDADKGLSVTNLVTDEPVCRPS